MAKPDLVFLTPKNDAHIRKLVEPQVRAEIERKEREAKEKVEAMHVPPPDSERQ